MPCGEAITEQPLNEYWITSENETKVIIILSFEECACPGAAYLDREAHDRSREIGKSIIENQNY